MSKKTDKSQLIAAAVDYVKDSRIDKPKDKTDRAIRIGVSCAETGIIGVTVAKATLGAITPAAPVAALAASLIINNLAFNNDDEDDEEE